MKRKDLIRQLEYRVGAGLAIQHFTTHGGPAGRFIVRLLSEEKNIWLMADSRNAKEGQYQLCLRYTPLAISH
jgi:hypothetical protein